MTKSFYYHFQTLKISEVFSLLILKTEVKPKKSQFLFKFIQSERENKQKQNEEITIQTKEIVINLAQVHVHVREQK